MQNQDSLWQFSDFQYHWIPHNSTINMPVILLATCLHAQVCNLFSPGNLASFGAVQFSNTFFWTSDLLCQYWFHPLQPSNSMLIDKDGSQAPFSLCRPLASPLLLQPQTPSPALIILPERRKVCFVNLDISCTSLLSLVSKLSYTIPDICLQMEWKHLRYEQTNEFNQPWKYNREFSVIQSAGTAWGFVCAVCTEWTDCISWPYLCSHIHYSETLGSLSRMYLENNWQQKQLPEFIISWVSHLSARLNPNSFSAFAF